ncbi:MAG: N-acetyl sugar amidotransferase, partial [Nitrospirae bacterium]|nr:N-acetyl sugar amidotransferase [Nitrospirota bacterium]
KATYNEPVKYDEEYFKKISSKVDVDEMVSTEIKRCELIPFLFPTVAKMKEAGVEGIHLGDYIFWDEERQVKFIKREYGWREDFVEGTYKRYKSVECKMAGVHDYFKYIKRGFGRATDHATRDVRAGMLSRGEGFELVNKYDAIKPKALDYYMEITGLSEEEIEKTLKNLRKGSAKKLP